MSPARLDNYDDDMLMKDVYRNSNDGDSDREL